MALEFGDLTEVIIGAAIEVHRKPGPGFLESVYENALVVELGKRGLGVEQQKAISIKYDGVEVGTHLDVVVQGQVIVDLKTIKAFEDVHFAVVRSQLRAAGLKHGLLLNFAGVTLQIKRVIAG